MAKMELGTTDVSKVYLGTSLAKGVYLGTTKVWPSGAYYIDTLNRADNASLGTDWFKESTNPASRIQTNAAQAGPVGSNTGRQACSWNTYQGGAVGGVLLSDNVEIRTTVKAPTTSAANNNYLVLYMSCGTTWGATANRMLCLMLSPATNPSSKLIVVGGIPNGPGVSCPEVTGGTNTLLTSTATAVAGGDIIRFYRVGTAITVLKNGAAFMSTSSSIPLTGVGNRRWGFCHEANYPFLQQQFSGPGIDQIEAFDI